MCKDKQFCIYKHTNKINGKVYIGQTCQSLISRWGRQGQNYNRSPLFYKAIQKYGWDNFEHEVLYDKLTSMEANLKEKEMIELYHSTNSSFGYNLREGGRNSRHAISSIEKLRGQHRPAKVKEKISNTKKGAQFTEQHKKNMSKPIVCIETNQIYYGAREAERQTKIPQGNITKCCQGKRRIAGGYHWQYLKGGDSN